MTRWSAPTASEKGFQAIAARVTTIRSGPSKMPPAPSSSCSERSRLRAVEIQSQYAKQAYDTRVAEIQARRDVRRHRARCLQAGRESRGKKGVLGHSPNPYCNKDPGDWTSRVSFSESRTRSTGRPWRPPVSLTIFVPMCGRVVQASDPLRFAFVDGLQVPHSRASRPLIMSRRASSFTSFAKSTKPASARSNCCAGA